MNHCCVDSQLSSLYTNDYYEINSDNQDIFIVVIYTDIAFRVNFGHARATTCNGTSDNRTAFEYWNISVDEYLVNAAYTRVLMYIPCLSTQTLLGRYSSFLSIKSYSLRGKFYPIHFCCLNGINSIVLLMFWCEFSHTFCRNHYCLKDHYQWV